MDSKKMMVEINENEVVEIEFTNWRGESTKAKIVPEHIYFGSAQWDLEDQWFLNAYDLDGNAYRDLPLKNIKSWTPLAKNG